VAVLEDRESALVQIKTLEDGVDNILQELTEVKGERDELQNALDEALQLQAKLKKSLDDAEQRKYDIENEQRIKDNTLSTMKASGMKADMEKSILSERVTALQNDLKRADSERNSARAEAAALATKLQESADQQAALGYRNDVSDIKNLVKSLEDSLKAAVDENAMLRGRGDEFKESDSIVGVDDEISDHIERDIAKCQEMSEWMIDEAQIVPSKALNYSTFIVQDGKSSIKRLRKAVKRDGGYLENLGIEDVDAVAITYALGIGVSIGSEPLFPVSLSPSAPRQ
jgi:predicted  nucleic acid-binding Zn-ribbon protein